MNIIASATFTNGQTFQSLRAVYYSPTDHTVVWQWRNGGVNVPLMDHRGAPVPLLDVDGNQVHRRGSKGVVPVFKAPPGDASGIVSYMEDGCGCSHPYKHYAPPDPEAEGAAWREHAR
jgi:hypothetical protein